MNIESLFSEIKEILSINMDEANDLKFDIVYDTEIFKLFDRLLGNNMHLSINTNMRYEMFLKYNINKKTFIGLDLHNVKYSNHVALFITTECHFICALINNVNKIILLYDPLGINGTMNRKQHSEMINIIKKKYVLTGYKTKFLHSPWQKYVNTEKEIWFGYNSCGVTCCVFSYLYMKNNFDADETLKSICNFNLKYKNQNLMRHILLLCFAYSKIRLK